MTSLLNKLVDVALEHAKANGYGDLVMTFICVLLPAAVFLVFVGWLIARVHLMARIGKLHAETEMARSETRLKDQQLLAEIAKDRKELDDLTIEFDEALKDIRDALRLKQKKRLRDARDKVCAFHAKSYAPVLERYLENCHSVLPKKERYLRMKGQIMPSLSTQTTLFEVINSDRFLKEIPTGKPYLINPHSAEIIFARVRDGIPFWRIVLRHRLNKLQKRWKPFLREH